MKNKQTAVEWLESELKKQGFLYDLDIEQAKVMEKEQTIEFANKVLYNSECSFTGIAYLEKDINKLYKEEYENR